MWRRWGCAVIVGLRKDRIDESKGRSEGVVTIGGGGGGVVAVVVVCRPEISSIENAAATVSVVAVPTGGSVTLVHRM